MLIKSSLNITVNKTFIPELEEAEIVLYPNPAKDKISITFLKEYVKLKLSLYDIYGNLLYDRNLYNPKSHNISLSRFSTGIYLISFSIQNKIISTKLIIK